MDVGILLVFAIVFLVSYLLLAGRKNLPPGPINFPLVGSVEVMRAIKRTRPHIALAELSREYGPVWSFRMGKQLFVVLHGYDAIYEALVKRGDVLSDRANHTDIFKYATKDGSGVVLNNYNHNWKVLRRFTLQALRDFGVGKSSLEEKISTEVEATSRLFNNQQDQPIDMNYSMQNLIGNIIFGIVFGARYSYDDPEFYKVRLLTNNVVTGDGPLNLSEHLPTLIMRLINMFSKQVTTEERLTNITNIQTFIKETVAEHGATFDENNIRDLVDLYIQTSRVHENDETTDFTKGALLRVINDLFIAGLETTSTSLDWAFLYMTEYPDVQKKCQDEIEEVLGDKPIQYADRDKLPFLNATSLEIQRITALAPLSVGHCPKTDTKLYGYDIPMETILLPSLYSASMDPKYWSEPEKFKPERFLDAKGKVIKAEALIPFSTGPRQCLGEPLAKMELFLIFSNLLQRFSFHRAHESIKHSLKSRHSYVTNTPEPYKLRVKSRK